MDRAALGQTYQVHRRGLYALALAITRCPARAEDAIHEAFARMCSRKVQLDGDQIAYVFASVRNAALDQQRFKNSGVKTVNVESPASMFNGHAPDPVTESERAERDSALRKAVDALPEEQREAIVLKVYAGLTFEQMAVTVQAPLPTVAARYRRALDKLKQSLGENA